MFFKYNHCCVISLDTEGYHYQGHGYTSQAVLHPPDKGGT